MSATTTHPGTPARAPSAPSDVLRNELETTVLRRLDAAAAAPSSDTIAALRATLTDLVDRLKSLGLAREDVVGAVQSLVTEHVSRGHTRSPLPRLAATREAAFGGQLPAWCVRAYAGDDWW